VKKQRFLGFAVIERIFKSALVRQRIALGHLGIIFGRFLLHLHALGYAHNKIRDHARVIEHFSRWLNQQEVSLKQLSTLHVRQFLRHHLPRCRCGRPAPKCPTQCQSSLALLVKFLRAQKRIKEGVAKTGPPQNPTDQLLVAYDRHLDRVYGLSAGTRRRRERSARRLLKWTFGSRQPQVRKIQARQVSRFVFERARQLGPAGIHALVVCLRSFLRFLELSGRLPQGLAAAVPQPKRSVRPAPVKVLEPQEWRRFLKSFSRSTATGRRDYAIALCLCTLALRSQEVAALTLDDVDWRAMTVRLSHTKQRRQRLLPLPDAVARAILDYLKAGRPSTQSRALFVYHRAPLDRGMSAQSVRRLVRRAFARCGIKTGNAYILRHTWATWAHRQGADLKLIADLLGHRSLETTQQYAHVNVEELRQVALPWPRIPR